MGRSRAKDLDAGCSVGVGHGDLSERVATIDEQPATGHQSAAEPGKRKRLSLAVAAVERTDPNCKGDVVTLLSGLQLKFLDCNVAWRQPSSRDQRCCRLGEQRDRLGRTVNGEHVTGRADALGDLACGSARSTADLDHPHPSAKRQGIDNRLQSRRQ